VIALLHPRLEALGGGDGEAHLHLTVLELAHDVEPGLGKHAQHRLVLGHHLGDETPDPGFGSAGGQLFEQPCADPAALLLVGDDEGDLGHRGVAQTDVVCEAHDAVVEPARQRAGLEPVGIEHGLRERAIDLSDPVKAQVETALREPLQEVEYRIRVARRGRPQPERAAVLEDDVDHSG
jgi:hypothetical protein